MDGGTGDDLLIGGPGSSTLTGGEGSDIFGNRPGPGQTSILDLMPGTDRIRIDFAIASDYAKFDAISSNYNEGGWGVIEIAEGQKIMLSGIDATTMSASCSNSLSSDNQGGDIIANNVRFPFAIRLAPHSLLPLASCSRAGP